MLGDTVSLRLGADHESRDVLEEDEGDAALSAELDEVGTLLSGRGEEDAIVCDDAYFLSVDAGEACDESGAEVALELREVGAIDDSRDDFTDGEGLAKVRGGNAEELLGVVKRLRVSRLRGGRSWPIKVTDRATCEGDGMCIINGEIICDTGDGGVHLAATEIFGRDDLTGGGLHKRRTGEEDVALLLDDDGLVRHSGDVGATSGARTHDDGDLGDAGGGHASLVVEDTTKVIAVGEDVGLVRQVGTATVNEVDAADGA